MCDCFHLVLPNWPGSPASVSGRQLRPDDPDAETEEDNSVNEVPIDEIIRPRPQGSSPVYEYSIDQEHFSKGEDTQTGRFSSGRRKSRWKRDSGESRSFSGRSQSEEPMEVTLQTDVEAGASGYSVTGGGKEGIFVKQVLKDSSAAKLFSMKEGDQLLSATIYFDNIKYEDALKILQYSEPYKVQFNIKRKLPSKDDTENVHHPTSSDVRETDQQGEGLTDGTMEAMEKMLEEEEDKEKLIVKSRTGRSQRPKKERLSWPKFQAKKTKKAVSHRRSHSTSDACEGRAPDLSPTSTDTELHFPREEMHLKGKKGSERKRKFLNIGFRMHRKPEIDDKIPKAGMTTAEARNKAAKDDQRISLDIQEPEMELGRLELQSAAGIPEHSGNEENKLKLQLQIESGTRKQEEVTSEIKATSGAGIGIPASVSGTLTGPHVSVRGRRKKSDDGTDTTKDTVSGRRHGLQTGKETRERSEDVSFGVQGLEIGIAKLTLQEPQEELAKGYEAPEIRVKIPTLQTPKFGFSKGKVSEAKGYVTGHEREQALGNVGEMLMETTPERNIFLPDVNGSGGKISVETPSLDHTSPSKTEKGTERSDWKAQKSSMKMPQMPEADVSSPKVDITIPSADVSQPKTGIQGPGTGIEGVKMEGEVKMGEKDMEGKESKFKMPKFKMPSFGWSPSKEKKGSVEVSLPKGEVDSSLKGKDKGGDLSLSLISSEIPKKGIDLSMKIQEEEVIVKDHKANDDMGIKGPKIQMPSIKIPQVSEADMEGAKVDISIPTVDVSLPKIKLNREDAGAEEERVNVKGDVRLKEKEGDHKESKFKIPRFSMPGFGWGGGKDIGSSVDGEANIKDTKMTITSYTLETEDNLAVKDKTVPTFEVDIEFPGGKTSKGEMHRVKMPSIKVPTLPDTQGKIEKSLTSEKMKTQEREIGLKMQGVESTDRKVKEKTERAVEIMENQKVEIKGIGIENKRPEGDIEIGKLKEKKGSVTIKGDMTKQSIKIVNTHLEGPKVDMKMPSVDVSIPKGKVDVKSPEIEVEAIKVEGKIKTGEKGDRKDSKFKRPKFKMPSFGVSAPSKEEAASVDVTLPKAELGEALLSVEGEVKGGDLSVEAPSVEVAVKGVDMERHLLEAEEQLGDLKGKTGGAGIKGHMPKVHIPSIKMPQMPKADIKGPKVDMTMPSVDVSLTKGKVDIKSTEIDVEGVKVEEDMKPGDKEVEVKDSKFKMAKFKMPSFGVSAPSKKGTASVDTNLPKADLDVYLPSIQGEVKGGDLSVEVPSVEVAVKGIDIDTHLPEGEVQLGDAKGKTGGAGIKGHMPKVHMPSIQMPQRPKADIKGPKVDITMPSVDVSFPKRKVEVKSPDVDVEGIKVEGDMKLGDQEEEGKDSKFKMPKFKMPSFGVSAPGKEGAASVDMNLPNAELDVSLPSVQGEVKGGDLSVRAPSVDLAVKGVDMETHLPEAEVQLGDLKGKTGGAGIKGHMPKVHMPSIKMPQMPKADIKGPKEDITIPSVDVSLPKCKVDIKSPDIEVEGVKVEGNMKLGDKEVECKDSKFKMPKFKMPSFGFSAPSKEGAASLDVTLPKADLDMSIPSLKGEVKGGKLSVQAPSVEVAVKGVDIETHLPEGEVQLGDLKGKTGGAGITGHMSKVHMPSIKMPEMPKADIKGPKMDITMPSVDVSLPKGKVDIKSPDIEVEGVKVEGDMKLGDKEVEGKDSKFKMPKFKMPSFGVSAPSKEGEPSVDVTLPKAELDVSLPSVQGEVKGGNVSVGAPSVEVAVKGVDMETHLPEAEVQLGDLKGKTGGAGIKGHMPKVHMPSIKMPQMPKADIKGPKVDITMPSVDVSLPKGKVEIKSPEIDVQGIKVKGDIHLGDKEVEGKDSKFKMPKFKMPSFGVSAPSKEGTASVDVTLPKAELDVSLPSVQGEVKGGDISVGAPSVEVAVKGVDMETHLPEGEVQLGDLKGKTGVAVIKGHMPKVHMPSIKMPQMPKADIKGPKVDITMPSVDVSLPKGKVEIKSPDIDVQGIKVEGDIHLEDKEVEGKDSKFKMPKFKKPSFGVSAPSKEASVDVTLPKAELDVSLPSVLGEVKGGDLSVGAPSVELAVKGVEMETLLPEGDVQLGDLKGKTGGAGIKRHMPKVHMPSIKMPQMPIADIKVPKVDITMPSVDVFLPRGKVDIQSPDVEVEGVKLEGDIHLGDKEVEGKDSKFQMPKFKMPHFGVSAPSKEGAASVDMTLPKAELDISLLSVQGEVKGGDLSVEAPSVKVAVKGVDIETHLPEGEVQLGDLKGKTGGAGFKGHMPKVHMPSIKMPQMPKADIKGPKVDITVPSVDVTLPTGKVEVHRPDVEVEGIKVEGDMQLGEKELEGKDSKFKMPKFKMPSFGVSAPSKEGEASVDMTLPKAELDVSLPSVQGDVKGGDLSVEAPSVEVAVKGVDIETHLPEGEVQLGDLKGKTGGAGFKGHMPKVHMPSIKMPQMPKADIKGPKVDITMPSVDVSLPRGKVDIKSPDVEVEGIKVEGDMKLRAQEVVGKDSKFKMPKFKMPSFGVSAPSKDGTASVDITLSKADLDVSFPSVQGEIKGRDLNVGVPSVELAVKGVDMVTHLPEEEVQLGDLKGKTGGAGIKGHMPKVNMPSMKMPQMAKADIKDPNMDITMPSVDMSLSKGKVDVKSPATEVEVVKVEGDMKLGVKVVEGKDSMFKMPKFKVPSFGSSPRKLSKTSVDSPSVYGDFDYSEPSESIVKGTDLSTSSVDDDLLLKDSKSKIDGSRMKIQMPKFSLPNIGFSKSEGKVSKSSTSIGSFQVDSNSSSLEISHTNLPAALDVVSPEIPSSNIPFIDIDPDKFVSNVQTSDIVMPESDFRGPQYEGSLKASDFHIFAKKPDSSVGLSEGETLEGELNANIAFSSPLDTPERHMQFPGVTFPGLSFTKINISGPHTETAKTRMKEDITLTKYEVILPMSGSHEASSFPQSGTITDLEGHSISLKTGEEPETSAGTGDSGMHTPPSAPPGTIKYPIFYKPKFGVSVSKPLEISHPQGPLEVAAEVTVQELPSFIPKREIMTSAETVTLPKYLSSVQTSQESSTPLAAIDVLDSDIALQTMKPEGVKPEGSESEGKEGFFKMPKFKLPSFSWSPKKEAASKGAPGSKPGDTSTMLDKGQTAADTETQTPHPDANIDVSTEKDGSKEKSKKTYFMMPKIGLSKVKGSTAGIGLQKEARGLTQPDDATTEEDNEKVTDTSGKIAVLDTEAVQVVVPAVMKQREMQVPEDRHSGKATAWESSGDKENVQMPKLGSSVAQVKSHNIHISIPKFEADVSPKSPKEDMETVVLETETYADVLKRNIDDKGLKLCQPTTISVSEVRVPSGENTIPLLMPSLGFSTGEMKAPRGETGEIVLPKHDMSMPGPQAIARGEEGIVGLPESKNYLLPTEGPIKLKTSSTEIPSQVSVIETGRVWEGSVLTIKFPKLQVPKFTFQAPNTEADIFIPKVREVMCPETDIEIAIHKESPDEWSAKVLKAVSEVPPQPSPDPIRPPKDLALSSVASPISKVKVHIQGAHVESQEVTIESRVTCEHGELPKRETFSTQIVRASEIPPSDIQTPSYGFSLLKVKIPESHVNLDVTGKEQETLGYTSSAFKTQDLSEVSLREDESGVDTVDLSLESELQPETGEPYEIISSSASLPKLKTFTFEVHSSHQYVDSCSDEEPAEILEFPPEESHGQTPPDEEEKEQKIQPESKKSSGLFRFWLPNIGFSSSVDEANSDPKTEASKSVPIETQPEAMPDPDPPKKPEKTGWFRFPKLGFSSSPAKKIQSTEESEAEPTKAGSQEEAEQTVIFFDAQETLSPEEREGGEGVTSTTNDDAQEPGALVTSAARTELILLEEEGKTSGKTGSGHAAK
ncbi:protein AHNAK2 [Petaurus breviceps papuanus]|uniref:protein AHNAK2 n=1 Tax=Petaurus breviceps papuanus TaxID=3040969 RepID=UPI0036DBB1C8